MSTVEVQLLELLRSRLQDLHRQSGLTPGGEHPSGDQYRARPVPHGSIAGVVLALLDQVLLRLRQQVHPKAGHLRDLHPPFHRKDGATK